MKTLAKYYACNHCVLGEKKIKIILIGPGKLPGPSRNQPSSGFKKAGLASRNIVHFLKKSFYVVSVFALIIIICIC